MDPAAPDLSPQSPAPLFYCVRACSASEPRHVDFWIYQTEPTASQLRGLEQRNRQIVQAVTSYPAK